MESITLDREVMHLRGTVMPRYAAMIYNGFWFAPERIALQKLFDKTAKPVTGTVRLKLYRGTCGVSGRKSPHSLYRPELATFEADRLFDQRDAEGFIKLHALRLKANAELRKKDD
jgi:argininosuccinate synthase